MGVIRWLDEIDSATWADAVARLEAAPPSSPEDAAAYLASYGRASDEVLISEFADLVDDESLRSSLLNSLLERAVTDRSWSLDKSLSHGIEQIPRYLSDLRCLNDVINFRGLDIEPPESCLPVDGSGLFGCITPARGSSLMVALQKYPELPSVAGALKATKPAFWPALFGARGKQTRLAAALSNEYFQHHWQSLHEAVLSTIGCKKYLGLGMSP